MTYFVFLLQSNFDASEGWHGALVDEYLNIRVPMEVQFTEHLLASRLVRKIKPLAENIMPFKQNHVIE